VSRPALSDAASVPTWAANRPPAGARPKRLALLGSTGSLGTQALKVVEEHPDAFEVVVLAANRNVTRMAEQVERYRPAFVAMSEVEAASALGDRLRGSGVRVAAGPASLIQAATHPGVDLLLSGVAGSAGLEATVAALEAGVDVAFADKEVLVLGGQLVLQAAQRSGARVLPVDSEMSAIFQCLRCCTRAEDVRCLFLTASGGPFRTRSPASLRDVTPSQALAHPNWTMGPKITVDSATLMNKGFEVIEASWLFGLGLERVRVVVHPQSIVHSYVEFVDGSLLAQMGAPDMRVPIQYALTYPDRLPASGERLDLVRVGALTFEEPDAERFPALGLAYGAARTGGTMPAVLSGADGAAVEAFLHGDIRFDQIATLVGAVMERHEPATDPSLADVLAASRWAADEARRLVSAGSVPGCYPPAPTGRQRKTG
jgi:1-deoxy-D-xylulose-5-phosphate reductoisomerase